MQRFLTSFRVSHILHDRSVCRRVSLSKVKRYSPEDADLGAFQEYRCPKNSTYPPCDNCQLYYDLFLGTITGSDENDFDFEREQIYFMISKWKSWI